MPFGKFPEEYLYAVSFYRQSFLSPEKLQRFPYPDIFNPLLRIFAIFLIAFNADIPSVQFFGRRRRGATSHERIQYNIAGQGKEFYEFFNNRQRIDGGVFSSFYFFYRALYHIPFYRFAFNFYDCETFSHELIFSAPVLPAKRLGMNALYLHAEALYFRSEERRVGKECRSRWSP